jgi:AcrR family transcriptional regulator
MTAAKRAIIVGAGIAGLAAALRLHQAGWQPVVIERAPARRDGGELLEDFGRGPAGQPPGRQPARAARETLIRDQIVRAAVELLDADGLDGLSMRRLGSRLGSSATAVYWHVKDKADLVVLAADAVWAEIDLPDVEAVGWRGAATSMAHGLYAKKESHEHHTIRLDRHAVGRRHRAVRERHRETRHARGSPTLPGSTTPDNRWPNPSCRPDEDVHPSPHDPRERIACHG